MFAHWLTDELVRQNWSGRELARRADISHSSVANVLGGQAPTWEFCATIAEPLKLSPVEVFLRAGKLTVADVVQVIPSLPNQTSDTEAELFTVVHQLDETDRRSLLRLLQGVQGTLGDQSTQSD